MWSKPWSYKEVLKDCSFISSTSLYRGVIKKGWRLAQDY